jgi:hypothetical protein
MGTLRNTISAVETQLTGLGYTRAKLNFMVEEVPSSIAHKSYSFGQATAQPAYHSGNTADYAYVAPFQVPILILWRVKGSHNASGTYQEGYLDALDAFEALESELVKNQLQANQENNLIASMALSPLIVNEQDLLLITIMLNIDVVRSL